MPKAVATLDTERFDLKSVDDGWVELRRLNYGEILKRREMSSRVSGGQSSENGRRGDGNVEMRLAIDFQGVQCYDFSRAIVDHNLDDGAEPEPRKLNFSSKVDVLSLDPRIAQEIEDIIDKMNNPPEESDPKTPSN